MKPAGRANCTLEWVFRVVGVKWSGGWPEAGVDDVLEVAVNGGTVSITLWARAQVAGRDVAEPAGIVFDAPATHVEVVHHSVQTQIPPDCSVPSITPVITCRAGR